MYAFLGYGKFTNLVRQEFPKNETLIDTLSTDLRKSSNQAETLIYILRKQRTLDLYSRSSLYPSYDYP